MTVEKLINGCHWIESLTVNESWKVKENWTVNGCSAVNERWTVNEIEQSMKLQ